jgi:acyl-CoA thioesterase
MNELERAQRCAERMYAKDLASQALGIEIAVPQAGMAIATMRVRDDMVNGFNICHGGLVFALADTAFAFACNAYDDITVAGGGDIEFLRPAVCGDRLRAAASEEYRGRRRGNYKVVVHNQQQQLVALFHGRSVSRGEGLLDRD